MSSSLITALATVLLALVGIAQAGILVAQRRQHRLELVESYRRRWADYQRDWATVVFVGRSKDGFYQIADEPLLEELEAARAGVTNRRPSVWARSSVRSVSEMMSAVCLRVLQGQLSVSDVYPIFGTALLRHSRALHKLMKGRSGRDRSAVDGHERAHQAIQKELQDWFSYHDGTRRRCLILIDLLWAEAARLEDLPPAELQQAAQVKERTGHINKQRVRQECIRLRGLTGLYRAFRLSRFLRHAEYRRFGWQTGIDGKRLEELQRKRLKLIGMEDVLDKFQDRFGEE